MAEEPRYQDGDGMQELTLVIESTPSIQVFVNKNDQISIAVTAIRDDMQSVNSEIVEIPIANAREVAKALIRIADAHSA